MEALDFAVGLGPVGPGPLRGDAELGAGVAPEVGRGRQLPLSDSTRSTMTPRSANQATAWRRTPDGGGGGLVVVDLGVGDAGVVIEDGVHERGADLGVAVVLGRMPVRCAVASRFCQPCWRPR